MEHRYEIHPHREGGPEPDATPVAEADTVGGALLAVRTLWDDGDRRLLMTWDTVEATWLTKAAWRCDDCRRPTSPGVGICVECRRDREDGRPAGESRRDHDEDVREHAEARADWTETEIVEAWS